MDIVRNSDKIPAHLPRRLTIPFPTFGLYDTPSGGVYHDVDRVVREHKERGFNCIRMDDGAALAKDLSGLRLLLITRGDKGALVYGAASGKTYESPAEKVTVVSAVGAGDSFSAAFLAEYLKTGDVAAALALATRVSAYVVSCEGAIPEYRLSDFT